MFTQFFIFFALMGIGYFARKKKWLDESSIKGMGNLLINITIPALLLASIFALDISGGLLSEFASMSLFSAIFFALNAFLAAGYVRIANVPSKQRGIVQVFMATTNNGFIGLPISAVFFGEKGLFLMIANNLIMNIILFTYGVILVGFKPEKRSFLTPLKRIANPGVLSIIIGLFFGVTGLVKWIPEAVIILSNSLGDIATPLSMIYIGATLHGSAPSSLFRNRLVLQAGLVRCTVLPVITYCILSLVPIPSLMSKIIFLVTMLPTAAILPVISSQYGQVSTEPTRFVLSSTLMSLLTMPLGVFLATISF